MGIWDWCALRAVFFNPIPPWQYLRAHRFSAWRTAAGGSIAGAAHQAFLDVVAIFDRDARAALAEVQRSERHLRDEMRRALRNDELSAEVRAFLGLALDRVVNGEMRVEGGMGEVERAQGAEADNANRSAQR